MPRLTLLAVLGLCLAQTGGALADTAGADAPSLSAEIKIATPVANGTCPQPVKVQAQIRVDGDDAEPVPIGYRFLKNGVPITPWRTIDTASGRPLDIRQTVAINSDDSRTVSPAEVGGGQRLITRAGPYRTKPTIGAEARSGGTYVKANTVVSARCLGETIAARVPNVDGAKPDLTVAGTLRIGNAAVRSGGSIVLRSSDVLATGPRGCTFRFSYNVANVGDVKAAAHASRLSRGALPVASALTPPLDPNRTRTVAGQILLPPGENTIRLRLDPFQSVVESDESNNFFVARVSAPRLCRQSPAAPLRPRATTSLSTSR